MALEGLALTGRRQKSLFSHWPALQHLFCYHVYWCGDTRKGQLWLYVCPFMIYWSYCGQEYPQDCAQACRRRMFTLVVLAKRHYGRLHCYTPGGFRGGRSGKGLMVKN